MINIKRGVNQTESLISEAITLLNLINPKTTNLPGDPSSQATNNTRFSALDNALTALYAAIVTNRLDNLTYGLSALKDLIDANMSELEIVDTHFHSWERCFEKATTPNGEIHVADSIGEGAGPFQINAGNNTWGDWVQILGSSDTPFEAGKTFFDFNKLAVVAVQRAQTYFVQVAEGESGAAGLAAKTYSDIEYTQGVTQAKPDSTFFNSQRHIVGTKIWARCMCRGQNLGTMDFFFKLHEYNV